MATENEVRYIRLFQMFSVMAHAVRASDLMLRMRRVTLGRRDFLPLRIYKCFPLPSGSFAEVCRTVAKFSSYKQN